MEISQYKHRIFLLSPAKVTGKRAQIVMRPEATFELATRLREQGAPLGEVFSFMSGLYFRGKLTYATAFAAPPPKVSGTWVITSRQGLLSPETFVTIQDLRDLATVSVDSSDATYVAALKRDAQRLRDKLRKKCSVVLLGSVATTKYLEPLVEVFGEQLVFPIDFVGRGDLSRGGLLLRASKTGVELPYAPVGTSTRHGVRPPKLARLIRHPRPVGAEEDGA